MSSHEKEQSALTSDVSQLHAVVASLKEQISALADKTSDRADDERRERLIEELSKQAAFVSTASLDARLQEFRSRLDAIERIAASSSSSPGGEAVVDEDTLRKQRARIEEFEKAISELRVIVTNQKTNLEEKVSFLSFIHLIRNLMYVFRRVLSR